MRTLTIALALAAALALPGCEEDHSGHDHSAGGEHDHDGDGHADHEAEGHDEDGAEHAGHDHEGEDGDSHAHEPPHGGLLVVCGTEFAHVELVFDQAAGELTAYCLGGHAEKPARIKAGSVVFAITAGNLSFDLDLAPVPNPLTGETVGDTSQFMGQDERFKLLTTFDGVIKSIELKGETFEGVPFSYPGAGGK